MQFLSEKRLNGCQIFLDGSVFLKTKSKPNLGFLHIPNRRTDRYIETCHLSLSLAYAQLQKHKTNKR